MIGHRASRLASPHPPVGAPHSGARLGTLTATPAVAHRRLVYGSSSAAIPPPN